MKDLPARLLAFNQDVVAKIQKGEPVTAPGVPKNYPDAKKLVTEDCIRPVEVVCSTASEPQRGCGWHGLLCTGLDRPVRSLRPARDHRGRAAVARAVSDKTTFGVRTL